MRRVMLVVAVALSVGALAQTTVKADQGKPGTQGPWPVTTTGGGGTATDGGGLMSTWPAPCSKIVQTNDAGVGTSAAPVPGTPAAGRIWIRICNSPLNSGSTQCVCSAWTCPTGGVAAGALGDVLLTSDCVTYNITTLDGGLPCCVCNGAGSFLPATECVP